MTRLFGASLPAAFSISLDGADGNYTATYTPDRNDGFINVEIGGVAMRWWAQVVELDPDGALQISGMTHGTKPLWNDSYWFVLFTGENPRIEYWGNQVLWRTDAKAQL